MDNQRTPSATQTNNLYHALGRIEGKIDGFTQKLSEHSIRVDVVEQIAAENSRRVAVHEERINNLEERPSMAQEVADLKNRLAYLGGGLAVLAFIGPHVFKFVTQAVSGG